MNTKYLKIVKESTINKDLLLLTLLQERYNSDVFIGEDGLEHYVRLEMSFEDYLKGIMK